MPSRLTWMKGAVAWELDLPLDSVHAVRTWGSRVYLQRLSDSDERPLPWPSARRVVRVGPAAPAAPGSSTRSRTPASGCGARTETVAASAGRWRVVEQPCGTAGRSS